MSILERDTTAIGLVLAAFCLVAVNIQYGPCLQRALGEPTAQHDIGAAALDHPIGHLAIGASHIDMNPGVGIDPLHLGDFAYEMNWLPVVVFGLKGMVGRQRPRGQPANGAGGAQKKNSAHQPVLLTLKSPLAFYIIGPGTKSQREAAPA